MASQTGGGGEQLLHSPGLARPLVWLPALLLPPSTVMPFFSAGRGSVVSLCADRQVECSVEVALSSQSKRCTHCYYGCLHLMLPQRSENNFWGVGPRDHTQVPRLVTSILPTRHLTIMPLDISFVHGPELIHPRAGLVWWNTSRIRGGLRI